jgi:hypothetical protein
MSITAIFAALATGQPCLIPESYRILIVQRILIARKKAVEWLGNATQCPVCEAMRLGLSEIRVNRTAGEVRYCECRRCLATFPAVGPKIEPDYVEEMAPKQAKKHGKNKRKR